MPTPVDPINLEQHLKGYNNFQTNYLITGFKEGFKISFKGNPPCLKPKNLKSAYDHPEVIEKKIESELLNNRIEGPFDKPPFQLFAMSPIGVVEKKEKGKYRMIQHLSYPRGNSVNDGIEDANKTVSYQNIDTAMQLLKDVGKGAFFAKTDVSNAFRIIPLHPDQYYLFGFHFRNKYYYDKCLPMGCSASCQIFESLSKAIHWIANTNLDINHMAHLLDDFLIIEKSEKVCKDKLDAFWKLCADIGVPLSIEKTFLPSQKMTFLGYELDSLEMSIKLPSDKIDKCKLEINKFLSKQKATLKEIQSLIGLLNFACGAVVPGRTFLRRLISLTIGKSNPRYKIRITQESKKDLIIWKTFLEHFNGKSIMLLDRWNDEQKYRMETDASGSKGYSAIFQDFWFYGAWNKEWLGQSIELKELYPIWLGLDMWKEVLANHCIQFYTDNEALVYIINQKTSKNKLIMWLLRKIVLICLQFNILFQAFHLSSKSNFQADRLSRFQVDKFKQSAPWARPEPLSIPPLLSIPKL